MDSVDCGDEVADWLCHYFKRSGLRLHFSAPSLEKRDSSKAQKAWEHPAKPGDMVGLLSLCWVWVLYLTHQVLTFLFLLL